MKIAESLKTATTRRQALPIHTGPLTKKFMYSITDEIKSKEGFYPQTALDTKRYLALLTFTNKGQAQAAAKNAADKGFPGAYIGTVYVILPHGKKQKVYVISNAKPENMDFGALLLTKDGFKN